MHKGIRHLADKGILFNKERDVFFKKDIRQNFVANKKSIPEKEPISPKEKKQIRQSYKM
jgi:hypothetical protein